MTRRDDDQARSSIARERWLERSVEELRSRFKLCGFEVPPKVRVSIGWPRGRHGRRRAVGQCWSTEASTDHHSEIFISPELGTEASSIHILDVLAHELVHAVVGTEAGHRAPFKRCAAAIGLVGPMTATTPGPGFIKWADAHIAKIGPYPTGALSLDTPKKQSTRLLKCSCSCGYIARVTRKWVEDIGPPICPADNVKKNCEEA